MADFDQRLSLLEPVGLRSGAWRDYAQLAKLRLNGMVLVTTLAGYLLGGGGLADPVVLLAAIVGAALAAIGAGALNQYLERDTDRLMKRTADRPLPAGRLTALQVLLFGSTCVVFGILLLAMWVNLLSAFLCVVTAVAYLFAYTPLKLKGPVATLVGAVPGGIPPMIGWAAARGELTVGAWVLFAILFTWQLPHFFAIAWIYRDDYEQAQMPMISHLDRDGLRTAQQIVMCTLNLLFVSLLPVAIGLADGVYFFEALVLGTAFLALGVRFAQRRTLSRARHVLFGSLIYLPTLLIFWLIAALQ
ncbi:MAG: protoheme IX farnesyltransferase [Planctomycetes bacterium]|nr:protoheme IX farnesyltransferase [Planctomycetota bacterium]